VIALLRKFAPPPGAPPVEVRRTGLRNALLGLFLAVFGVLLVMSLDRLARGALLDPTHPRPSKLRAVSGIPIVVGLVAMIVGVYRAITGVHPERDGKSIVSRVGRLSLATMIAAAILFAIVYVTVVASRPVPALAP
jgi:hypothetical protein